MLKKHISKTKTIFTGENRPSAEDYDQMLNELKQLKQIFRNKFRQEIEASSNKKYSVLSTFEKEKQSPLKNVEIPKVTIPKVTREEPLAIQTHWTDRVLRASQVPSSTKPDSVTPLSLKGADLNDEYNFDGNIPPKDDRVRDFDIISPTAVTPETPEPVVSPISIKTKPVHTKPIQKTHKIQKIQINQKRELKSPIQPKAPIQQRNVKANPIKKQSIAKAPIQPNQNNPIQIKPHSSTKKLPVAVQQKVPIKPKKEEADIKKTEMKKKPTKVTPIPNPIVTETLKPIENPPDQIVEQTSTKISEITQDKSETQSKSPIKGFFQSFIPRLKKDNSKTKTASQISKSSLEIQKVPEHSLTVKSRSLTALDAPLRKKTSKKTNNVKKPSLEALKSSTKSGEIKKINKSKSPLAVKKVINAPKNKPKLTVSKSMDSIMNDKKKSNALPVKKVKSTVMNANGSKSPLAQKKFIKKTISNESKSLSSKVLKSGSTKKSTKSIDGVIKKSSQASLKSNLRKSHHLIS